MKNYIHLQKKENDCVKKKVISILLSVIMLIGMLPFSSVTSFAGLSSTYSEYNPTTKTFEDKDIPINAAEIPSTEISNIEVSLSGSCYIVKGSVTIRSWLVFNSDTLLILTDGSTLTVDNGINIAGDHSLNICSSSLAVNKDDIGKIIIENGGIHAQEEGSSITINGGNITATANDSSDAVIGSANVLVDGSYHNSCESVTINGGYITATNNNYGAAIGSGYSGSCNNITINGGTITAEANYGAAIGSGDSANCGDITINGGVVTAINNSDGAAIGGGCSGFCDDITINGGVVSATNTGYGPAIGGGYWATCNGNITITGGTVTAMGQLSISLSRIENAVGCNKDIIISGGNTTVISRRAAMACENMIVNGGKLLAVTSLTTAITDLAFGGPAISCKSMTINGGNFEARGTQAVVYDSISVKPYMKILAGRTPAGLGEKDKYTNENCLKTYIGYYKYDTDIDSFESKDVPENAENITDSASDLTLTGNCYAVINNGAKIEGTLTFDNDALLVIPAGTVLETEGGITVTRGHTLTIATSILNEADMGKIISEYSGITVEDGADLVIYGGDITAKSPYGSSAGIGSSQNSSCGNITIYGGKIYAEGGLYGGAGIGSGWYDIGFDYDEWDYTCYIYDKGTTGTITIYGGDITAQGGAGAAGIGGGYGCDSGNVTVFGGKVNAFGGECYYDYSYVADGLGCGWLDALDDDGYLIYSQPVEGGTVHVYGGEVYSNGNRVDIEHQHKLTKIEAREATCTETGISEAYYVCDWEEGCGKYFADESAATELTAEQVAEFIIPITHNYTSDIYYDNGDGTHSQKCSLCGMSSSTKERHTFVNGVCSICGADNCAHTDYNRDNVCEKCGRELYVIRDWNENNKKIIETYKSIPDTAVVITSEMTVLDAARVYVVDVNSFSGGVRTSNRLTVNGTPRNPTYIVIKDGCKLNANSGIEVNEGKALCICSQSGDKGELYAYGNTSNAAIGGSEGQNGGSVTIHGGIVTASTNNRSAGIGGGESGNGGTITINGGTVNASGGSNASGIGGGLYGNGGTVTVNGGVVNATGGLNAAGIGGGDRGNGGTVVINNGTVTAYGGEFSLDRNNRLNAIGKGDLGQNNGTFKINDALLVEAGSSAGNITSDVYDGQPYVKISNGHNYKSGIYRDNGNGTHSQKCTGCDVYGATEEHTFVDGVCVCGACVITAKNGAAFKNGFIYGLAPKLTSLTHYIDVAEGYVLETNTDIIGTGTVINAVKDNITYASYAVVIYGDITGDGVVDVLDVVLCERASNGHTELEGAYFAAGDLNESEAIDASDYSAVVNAALA